MKNVKIRLGGVPEHFNLPIHLAKEQGVFSSRGVDLEWTDFGGGTGQMTKALRENEVDACILLTEGMIKDIIKGSPCKIISEYVTTPLTWGIHTGVNNELMNYRDIFTKQYAISRFGSGSHLMAIVDADSKGYRLEKDQFTIIKDINGALPSLDNLETDVFYWEKYTTKPYVDAGQLRRIGEYNTPWPCFVIAASGEFIKNEEDTLKTILEIINTTTEEFKSIPSIDKTIANRYEQQLEDVQEWLSATEWSQSLIDKATVTQVQKTLLSLNIIDRTVDYSELVHKL